MVRVTVLKAETLVASADIGHHPRGWRTGGMGECGREVNIYVERCHGDNGLRLLE